MKASEIIEGLETGIQFVSKFSPIIGIVGGPAASIVNIASLLVNVASNVSDRIKEGKIVATATEAEKIRQITAKLATINDELMTQIAAS